MSVIFINSHGFGSPTLAMSYVTSTSASPSNATHTFNSVSLGAEDGTRKIIVAVGWAAGSDTTINSVTVNGVSATQVVAADAATGACGSALWIADVPTGTSVTVTVVFSASTSRSVIGIYRVVNLNSSTAHHTNTATSASSGVISATLNLPASGFALGVVSSIDGASGQAWAWDSGGTEDFDINIGNQSVHGGAQRTATVAETGTTFQATMNAGGSRASMVLASWGN